MGIIKLLRIIFGFVFVLFLPGLAWSFVFFKKGEIDVIERIALSFRLSIVLVPLVVFWLNWLLKIRINIVNVTAVILGLISCALIVLLKMRRFPQIKIPPTEKKGGVRYESNSNRHTTTNKRLKPLLSGITQITFKKYRS